MKTIKNIKIINHNNVIQNANITIGNDGVIKSIKKVSGKATQVALPELIDIHYHGKTRNDKPIAKTTSHTYFKNMLKDLFKAGTHRALYTTVAYNLDGIEQAVIAYMDFVKNYVPSNNESKFIGINLEGPFLSPAKAGAQYLPNFTLPTKSNLKYLEKIYKLGEGYIKAITIAPELKNSKELILLSKKYDVKVLMGHTNATYQEAIESIKLGVSGATHLWQAMTGVERHSPGGATSALLTENIFVEFIPQSNRHDIKEITYRTAGADKIMLITDTDINIGMGDGEYYTNGEYFIVKNNVIRRKSDKKIVKTTSRSKNKTILQGVRSMLKNIGDNEKHIAMIASANAHNFLSLKKPKIVAGQKANFVICDTNYKLKEMIKNEH